MLAFQLLQGIAAALAIGLGLARLWKLAVAESIDLPRLERAIASRSGDDARTALAVIRRHAATTWLAELLGAALDGESGLWREVASDIAFRASSGVRALRIAASVGTALGLLGSIWSLRRVFDRTSAGLAALQAGLVERLAFEDAMLCMTLGVATAFSVLAIRQALARAASRRIEDVRTVESLLERLEM